MALMNRIVACGVGAIVALALAGCGHQSGGTATSNSVPPSAAAGGERSVTTPLKITSWGPDSTEAGTAFNKQPNGSAALWIRVNQSLAGDEAAVEFNGTLLQGTVSGNLVTAGIPDELYARAGTYEVRVIVRRAGRPNQSNTVTFTVK